MNAVLITARGNNQSIPGKNLLPICGKPCLQWVIEAAQAAKKIESIYLSTEDPDIAALGKALGCSLIDRPMDLAQPDTHHGDVIRHGVKHIQNHQPDLNCVTVLLGNTTMISGSLIDLSLEILEKQKEYDGVMSVWQAQDDHPYRALSLDEQGCLKSFLNVTSGTSRQYYPPVYFYDQGVWTVRARSVALGEGPNPWTWMGKKVFPIIREWIAGRDVHTAFDVEMQEYWLRNDYRDEVLNKNEIMGLGVSKF